MSLSNRLLLGSIRKRCLKRNKARKEKSPNQEDDNNIGLQNKKKKKKKKKKQSAASEPSTVRTFRKKGVIIETLARGKPDGEIASSGDDGLRFGDTVRVRYTGKLRKNGEVIDSNQGWGLMFRLGVDQVISGLDVGIEGMRVGEKRRLTIPPYMGYGCQGASNKIPPNSWLIFDVELVDIGDRDR